MLDIHEQFYTEQVKNVFDRYIQETYDGNLDLVPYSGQEFDDFLRYVLRQQNGRFVGRTTAVLLKEHFNKKLGVVEE